MVIEGQATQRPKEKGPYGQTTIYKTEDRTTRTPLKTRSELMCSGRESSSCTTFDLVTVVSHLLHTRC
jgi:hypothetical protein